MAFLSFFIAGLAVCSAPAQVLNLVSGHDFVPLVDEQDPQGGITTEILRKALATQGYDIKVAYLPWARGYQETKNQRFDATYPYVKTPSREKDFLFSDPLYVTPVKVFVAKASYRSLKELKGKTICSPMGYETVQIKKFIDSYELTQIQTPSLTSCLEMITRKRVDAIAIPEKVAWQTILQEFKTKETFLALNGGLKDISYYVMVSRTHPRAKEILKLINKGLRKMKKEGSI